MTDTVKLTANMDGIIDELNTNFNRTDNAVEKLFHQNTAIIKILVIITKLIAKIL